MLENSIPPNANKTNRLIDVKERKKKKKMAGHNELTSPNQKGWIWVEKEPDS